MLKIYVFLYKIFGIFKYIHDTCRHVHIQSFINFFFGGVYMQYLQAYRRAFD